MAYEEINGKVVITPTRESGAGRKGFFNSKKEQYRQYRAYQKQYREVHKDYADNMTKMYSYNAFKKVRSEDIETAYKLGVKPSSYKSLALEQVRTSYDAARTRTANFKGNLKNVIAKERRGETLSLVEEKMLEFGTEEVLGKDGKIHRVMKDISWKKYRNEEGPLVDLNNELKKLYSEDEIGSYEEDVFGSP